MIRPWYPAIIPELAESAFGSATVRQVMDMTTALDFSEDYSDPKAGIWVYSAAANPLPKPADYKGPIGYYAYLQTREAEGNARRGVRLQDRQHRCAGLDHRAGDRQVVTDFLSERIWSNMGAEQDGYITIDALGTAVRRGRTERWLARSRANRSFMLNDGMINGAASVPGGSRQEHPAAATRRPSRRPATSAARRQLPGDVVGLPQRSRRVCSAWRSRSDHLRRPDGRHGPCALCLIPAGQERLHRSDIAARLSGRRGYTLMRK